MSKILKNTTGSPVDIIDVGQTVPASSQITIAPQDYLLYADSDNVVTLVGDETLVVNDGSVDLSISDGVNLIKGLYPTSISLQNPSGQSIINGDKLKVEVSSKKANQSAFNDELSESVQPITQISANYGIEDPLIETFEATGGTADTVDEMFRCQTGTNLGGYSVIRTINPTLYREGQGLMWRGTSIFSSGVANSLQFAGLFNLNDTLAFGYRGTDFGIIYENYGSAEIRKIQITNSGNGNLTLTLDSTVYTIPISSGTVNKNAYEIEKWINSNQSIWKAEQRGDSVFIQSQDTSLRNGTYSVSGTSLNATFSTVKSGSSKNIDDILQSEWDNNPTWFDPTKSNVYMIKLSYLGFGPIRFFIMNTDSGEWELVHTIKPLGVATKPSISSRALKSGWIAASLGSTTNLTVKGGSAATFIEGDSKIFGESKAHQATNTSIGSTYEAILTLRANRVYSDNVNLGRLVPLSMNLANDAAKPVEYIVVKNCTLGETNYVDHKSNSIASLDENDHLYNGDGEVLLGGVMSSGGSPIIDLESFDIELELGQHITIYARKRSGTNPEVNCTLIWKEDL